MTQRRLARVAENHIICFYLGDAWGIRSAANGAGYLWHGRLLFLQVLAWRTSDPLRPVRSHWNLRSQDCQHRKEAERTHLSFSLAKDNRQSCSRISCHGRDAWTSQPLLQADRNVLVGRINKFNPAVFRKQIKNRKYQIQRAPYRHLQTFILNLPWLPHGVMRRYQLCSQIPSGSPSRQAPALWAPRWWWPFPPFPPWPARPSQPAPRCRQPHGRVQGVVSSQWRTASTAHGAATICPRPAPMEWRSDPWRPRWNPCARCIWRRWA